MKILLFVNPEKCKAEDGDKLKSFLQSKGHTVVLKTELRNLKCDSNYDIAIVMGGDGSVVSMLRYLSNGDSDSDYQSNLMTKIIGINYGKLGYLSHFSIEEVMDLIWDDIILEHNIYGLGKTHEFIKINKLELSFRTNFRSSIATTDLPIAFNDIVIDIGKPFRMISIDVYINDQLFSEIRGDGVILSTPTGSTAYNMSAGGPIVQPNLNAMILTPKNPHKLSIRPIVLMPNQVIKLVVKNPEGVFLIIDGQFCHEITSQTPIRIETNSAEFRIVENPNRSCFQTLTQKLGWGI